MNIQTHYDYLPPSSSVNFYYKEELICDIPSFLFLNVIRKENPEEVKHSNFENIQCYLYPEETGVDSEKLIDYLQSKVEWEKVSDFVNLPINTIDELGKAWNNNNSDDFSVKLEWEEPPEVLYRYFNEEYALYLLEKMELYFPAIYQFNDPFDCYLEDKYYEKYKKCGLCCFNEKNDSTLMFSHYAESHKGVCVAFDPYCLKSILEESGINAHWRKVRYFKENPRPFPDQPLYFISIKHTDWSYEKEYRLFREKKQEIQLYGSYEIVPEAIKSIVFGVNSTEKFVDKVKKLTSEYSGIKYYKANRDLNVLGININQF